MTNEFRTSPVTDFVEDALQFVGYILDLVLRCSLWVGKWALILAWIPSYFLGPVGAVIGVFLFFFVMVFWSYNVFTGEFDNDFTRESARRRRVDLANDPHGNWVERYEAADLAAAKEKLQRPYPIWGRNRRRVSIAANLDRERALQERIGKRKAQEAAELHSAMKAVYGSDYEVAAEHFRTHGELPCREQLGDAQRLRRLAAAKPQT